MEYKFKVGDHVRVADWSFEYCGDYRDKVGVVKRNVFEGKYGVELAGYWNHSSSGGYFWFNTQSLIPQEARYSEITKVIFNNPATIVFWSDGKKTVVKCGSDEVFDEEKGLAMAISKRVLGNQGNYYNEFKKWVPEIESCEDKGVSMDEVCREACKAIESSNKAMNGTARYECNSCAYLDTPINDEPCKDCFYYNSKYKPKKRDEK